VNPAAGPTVGPASAGHCKAAAGLPPEGGPTSAHVATVLVIAVGNRSRGDDALGPLLLERLVAHLAGRPDHDNFELIEDFQLQIEHALDVAGRRLVLFIDAGTGTAAPFGFHAVAAAAPLAGHSTHALAPQAVLGVHRQIAGEEPPPAFVLCVRGERFGLGDDLSDGARAHLEAAWRHLVALCDRPEVQHWRDAAGRCPSEPAARAPFAEVSAAR
jgi:hydrogenase maturation protease